MERGRGPRVGDVVSRHVELRGDGGEGGSVKSSGRRRRPTGGGRNQVSKLKGLVGLSDIKSNEATRLNNLNPRTSIWLSGRSEAARGFYAPR